jgi:hypothetical protein
MLTARIDLSRLECAVMSLMNQTSDTHRSKAQTALLAGGLGGVLFVLTFLLLGALAPGYDALRETISALEFTPWGSPSGSIFLSSA